MRNLIIIVLIALVIGVTLNLKTHDTKLLQNTQLQQDYTNSKLAEFDNNNNDKKQERPDTEILIKPDFDSYMKELKKDIKANWEPPNGKENRIVVLLFKIAKDGNLISYKIHKSSGIANVDRAALKAVELTAPFKPLPKDFEGQNIDIQFTFDYRTLNSTK